MITVYGIPNCDMVKKALTWFDAHNMPYQFHNFKTDGISEAKLLEWINIAGLDLVVNKRSTTWRNLSGDIQKQMADIHTATKIAISETSIIKRPVVETHFGLIIGFNEQDYEEKFAPDGVK